MTNSNRTANPDLSGISRDAFPGRSEALSQLARLREELAATEAALRDVSALVEEADKGLITAEADLIVGGGDRKRAEAARVRLDQANAQLSEIQRRKRIVAAAIAMQQGKLTALEREAREHVRRVARALDEPIMQEFLQLAYAAALKLQEHEAIKQAVVAALGGLYGAIADPRLPEMTVDKVRNGAGVYGSIDNIARALKEAGYDVEVRGLLR